MLTQLAMKAEPNTWHKPEMNGSTIAAFKPPLLFANTAIVALSKNTGTNPAITSTGLFQVFGSAFIASWVGMAAYGGYLGMWDWAVVWPVFTVAMKFLSYAGLAIVVIVLLVIPQLQYRADKEGYFMMTEDWEAYEYWNESSDNKHRAL